MEQEYKVVVNSKEIKELKDSQKSIIDKLTWIGEMLVVPPDVPVDPPVIVPPISDKYAHLGDYDSNPNYAFQKACIDPDKSTILEIDKFSKIDEAEEQTPTIRAIVMRKGVEAGNWESEFPRNLFYFPNGASPKFAMIGSIYQPIGHPIGTDPIVTDKTLFRTGTAGLESCMLSQINCAPPSADHLSWGISGFSYASSDVRKTGKYMDFIQYNVLHNGSGLHNFKSNANKEIGANNIRWNAENLDIFNPVLIRDGLSDQHMYHPTSFLISGEIVGNYYKITSDNKFSQIRSKQHRYRNDNVRSLINFGRFIFSVEDRLITNDKILNLEIVRNGDSFDYLKTDYLDKSDDKAVGKTFVSDQELHAGDITSIGKVIAKQLCLLRITAEGKKIEHADTKTAGKYYTYAYILDSDLSYNSRSSTMINSSFNLSGSQPAWIVYKYNYGISFYQREDSEFGNKETLLTPRIAYTAYSDEDAICNLRNVNFNKDPDMDIGEYEPGYYRKSADRILNGIGHQLENVIPPSGQWPPVPILSDKTVYSQEVIDEINWGLSL